MYRHGNRDEMASYFRNHHVPPLKSNIHSCRDGYTPLIPSKRCFKLLSDGGRRSMLRLYN
ncbi:hypothetical protein DWY54_15190 [Parabacteroides distasonis]|nr:hypothetical protein DWY54_15190 [Parabacteroides distasonis]RHK54590.1 hypothetical protein DW056_13730 [Parabacteroides distasonis]